jgi:hypothetical protein
MTQLQSALDGGLHALNARMLVGIWGIDKSAHDDSLDMGRQLPKDCLFTTTKLNKASIIGLVLMRLHFIFMIPLIHKSYSLWLLWR